MSPGGDRASLFRVMNEIAEERRIAQSFVKNLARDSSQLLDTEITASLRTAGLVEELSAAAYLMENGPIHSISLAQLALAVATSIKLGTYPSIVHAKIEGNA